MFDGPLSESLLGRARKANVIDVRVHNLRDWSDDARHRKVDDRPFGGGAGMVIRAEPIYRALKALGCLKKGKSKLAEEPAGKPWVVYLSPQGDTLTQTLTEKLVKKDRMVLLCGHYEGIDERVMRYIDQEISIGDYVLTGGELPAMVVIDALARLVPGVVGDPDSVKNESFTTGILDHPHYTRPSVWRGRKVPSELLSGNHRAIEKWRGEAARKQTAEKRPELLTPSSPRKRGSGS